jgi:hypothetical protein
LPSLLGGGLRRCLGVVRQPGEIRFVFDPLGVGVGRVEQVLGKLRAQRGKLFLDFLEARLLVFGQFRTGEAEIAQFVFDDAAPGR